MEDVPPEQQDWHPGSSDQVLDLVHPSLFPLVYGKSKVLAIGERVMTLQDCIDRAGEGSVIPVPEKPVPEAYGGRHWIRSSLEPYSTKFQWLPCEVDISQDKPKWVLPFFARIPSSFMLTQDRLLYQQSSSLSS